MRNQKILVREKMLPSFVISFPKDSYSIIQEVLCLVFKYIVLFFKCKFFLFLHSVIAINSLILIEKWSLE